MAEAVSNRCSFCGKPQPAVKKLVHGPEGVAICNECVALCVEMMSEALEESWATGPARGLGETAMHLETSD